MANFFTRFCGCPRATTRAGLRRVPCAQIKAKAHVLSKPLNVIRAPGVVEEADVKAAGEVRLRIELGNG